MTQLFDPSAPRLGEFVTIADQPGALTWQVVAIDPEGSANGPLFTLESGQTGRRRYETADHISPYRRVTS